MKPFAFMLQLVYAMPLNVKKNGRGTVKLPVSRGAVPVAVATIVPFVMG